MSKTRLIGGLLLLAGFVAAFFGDLNGLVAASALWIIGTLLFSRSFL